jgi:hypothetical protein
VGKLIHRLKKLNGGEMASRECPNSYSKRKWEKYIFITSITYLLGISRIVKSRLIIWSSGDISTAVGVQTNPLSPEQSFE